MPGVSKQAPLAAFQANIGDAHHLVALAEGLTNERARRMRKELRDRVGAALKISAKDRERLDCLQSRDVFLTFLPESRLARTDFLDQRPLLRQALVAACAATETYLADKVMERVGPLLRSPAAATKRMRDLPLTLGCWLEVERRYERRRWGMRGMVVEPYVRQHASTASNRVGEMLSLIGVEGWAARLDKARGVAKGETVAFLDRVTERRNKIAHQGDRSGRGRARLAVDEVQTDLAQLESIVNAIEAIV